MKILKAHRFASFKKENEKNEEFRYFLLLLSEMNISNLMLAKFKQCIKYIIYWNTLYFFLGLINKA